MARGTGENKGLVASGGMCAPVDVRYQTSMLPGSRPAHPTSLSSPVMSQGATVKPTSITIRMSDGSVYEVPDGAVMHVRVYQDPSPSTHLAGGAEYTVEIKASQLAWYPGEKEKVSRLKRAPKPRGPVDQSPTPPTPPAPVEPMTRRERQEKVLDRLLKKPLSSPPPPPWLSGEEQWVPLANGEKARIHRIGTGSTTNAPTTWYTLDPPPQYSGTSTTPYASTTYDPSTTYDLHDLPTYDPHNPL